MKGEPMSNHVTEWEKASINATPDWLHYGGGVYRRKFKTMWIALTPEQIAVLRDKSKPRLGWDHLKVMLKEGNAVELDNGAIVVRIQGANSMPDFLQP
jgi:hypothetical protein